MTVSDALLETVRASIARSGLDADTVAGAPAETIAPPLPLGIDPDRLFRPDEVALELHEALGEGAMGLVRRATQRALGRSVAVKSVKPEMRSERATVALLREAWVTGALEHPNVVPVHDLARDDDGAPLVVLKQVEGLDWGNLMRDAESVRERFGAPDLLEWNLRVLGRVADAVAFAHDRGFLHRDLKPENVMIGAHGEVYVVDWGLAVTTDPEPRGLVPAARHSHELAGTPAYMAPEMLGGGGERLGPSTDVYLLGAILHEILDGQPPHRGETLMEIVASIAGPTPAPPPGAPRALIELLARALAPEVSDRLDDALVFGRALEDHLRHRSGLLIARRAEERLAELEDVVRGARRSWVEARPASPYPLFGECRFGFLHALEVWPESEDARAGLARAVELMVEHQLEQGQPHTALALLAEHPEAPEALRGEVEAAIERAESEGARLRALRDALDPRTGRRARMVMAGVLGLLWILQPLVTGFLDQAGIFPVTHENLLVRNALLCSVLVALGIYIRRSLRTSRVNRHLMAAALTAAFAQVLLHATDAWAGATVEETTRHQFPVWAALTATVAASVNPLFTVSAVFYAAAFVVLTALPEYGWFAATLGNAVLLGVVVVTLLRTRDRPLGEPSTPERS